MSERSFPFDDVSGDRQLDTAQWARLSAALTNNGIVPGFANELEVVPTAPESLAVDVSLGRFHIEGRYYEVFSEPVTVALTAADPTDPRIDRIVVRRDLASREVVAGVVTGTPAPSPTAPALTQSPTGVWEEPLALVDVAASASTITAADITDDRRRAQSPLLPSLGWVPIAQDVEASVSSFIIDLTDGGRFPAGTFSRIKVSMRGNLVTGPLRIFARVNNDSTPGLHRSGMVTQDSTGAIVVGGTEWGDENRWRVGYWHILTNNTCEIEIYGSQSSGFGLPYQATATRNGTTAGTHQFSTAGGRLEGSLLISSLQMSSDGGTWDAVRWWAEGYVDGFV